MLRQRLAKISQDSQGYERKGFNVSVKFRSYQGVNNHIGGSSHRLG